MNKKLLIVSVILILLFPLPLMVGWFFAKSLPKFYSSYTTVLVNKERLEEEIDPVFLQTQYEIIKSRTVLYPVIAKLNLTKIIAQHLGTDNLTEREAHLYLVKKYLNTRQFRGTKLIEIVATSPNPDEAALIANAVAEQFAQYQTDKMREAAGTQPDYAPVMIVNQAEPNPYPVKPKFALIMIVSGVVGLAPLSAGVILLIVAAVWRRK